MHECCHLSHNLALFVLSSHSPDISNLQTFWLISWQHDTGGHPNYEDKDPMFKYLRVRGPLPAGAIITVEPGVSCLFFN
jgi:hypothetical protein